MQPVRRRGLRLPIRQAGLSLIIAEMQIKERSAGADYIFKREMVIGLDHSGRRPLLCKRRNQASIRTAISPAVDARADAPIEETAGQGKIFRYPQVHMRAQPELRIETESVRSLIAVRESLIHRQTARIADLPVNAGERLFQGNIRKDRKGSVADAVACAQQCIVVVGRADIESRAQIV